MDPLSLSVSNNDAQTTHPALLLSISDNLDFKKGVESVSGPDGAPDAV